MKSLQTTDDGRQVMAIVHLDQIGPGELKSSSLCLYSSNLGIFWLKIEQFWPFEEISIFSNGGHLGYRTALTDTILKGDHLRIIQTKFLLKLAKWFLTRRFLNDFLIFCLFMSNLHNRSKSAKVHNKSHNIC